jgi:pimeloyl-ACP methyl ester carboxylesterase
MIEAGGAELCSESFGSPDDPPVLLIAGIGSSMLWWEEDFCRLLATGGRFVIRYDHRDTGRSTHYEPGKPGYTSLDFTTDAVRVLDGWSLDAAHVSGISAGAAMAQELALEFPDRVLSLVLLATTAVVSTGRQLPGSEQRLMAFFSKPQPDWSDAPAVIDYTVEYARALTGSGRSFDEPHWRELITREAERARDIASAQNHELLAGEAVTRKSLADIAAPTLVIHGSSDPMFPLPHGEALAEEIPGSRLLVLEGAGHELHRDDWDRVAQAVLEHTAG